MEWNGKWKGIFWCVFCGMEKNGMEVEWKVEWKIFINAKESGKWNGMEWNGKWKGKFLFMSCGKEKKWNGNGMESRMENFHKCYREWKVEWNGMEWKVEWKIFSCFLWNGKTLEWKVEWKWNGII